MAICSGEADYRCIYGSCVTFYTRCPEIPSKKCQGDLGYECPEGNCVFTDRSCIRPCGYRNSMGDLYVERCHDYRGKCVIKSDEQTFQCPILCRDYSCADGRCVKDYRECDKCFGKKKCDNGNCYSSWQRCDGYNSCADWSDEKDCPLRPGAISAVCAATLAILLLLLLFYWCYHRGKKQIKDDLNGSGTFEEEKSSFPYESGDLKMLKIGESMSGLEQDEKMHFVEVLNDRPEALVPLLRKIRQQSAQAKKEPITSKPKEHASFKATELMTSKPEEHVTFKTAEVITSKPKEVMTSPSKPKEVMTLKPKEVVTSKPTEVMTLKPKEVVTSKPTEVMTLKPKEHVSFKAAEVMTSKPRELPSKAKDHVTFKAMELISSKPKDVTSKPKEHVVFKPVEYVLSKPTEFVTCMPKEHVSFKPMELVSSRPTEFVPYKPKEHVTSKKEQVATKSSEHTIDLGDGQSPIQSAPAGCLQDGIWIKHFDSTKKRSFPTSPVEREYIEERTSQV